MYKNWLILVSLDQCILEVHRLLADNRYRLIIGQFADNRYQPFDNRHWPIVGQLFALVSKTTKMLLNAVYIDDSEITNDSVISRLSFSTFSRTKYRRKSKRVDAIQLQL